ncbi:MAG: putative DNA binding domain-containing protein [Succinivibrio sp.]|nr:putative DNA binding domain-containing protein [Succinivibrio sp.]
MRESQTLELQESIDYTFLKAVSAYANYETGTIRFGIDHLGKAVGLKHAERICKVIERSIHETISPVPDFDLVLDTRTQVVTLTVHAGLHKPYLCMSKAYRRLGTDTVEVSSQELGRLVLDGVEMAFEALPASEQDLGFTVLEDKLSSVLGVEKLTLDVLRALGLYQNLRGYNQAAQLLSDCHPFGGIEVICTAESAHQVVERADLKGLCVLTQYDRALEIYRRHYQLEELMEGVFERRELLPESAFREALAVALCYCAWDEAGTVLLTMGPAQIELKIPIALPREAQGLYQALTGGGAPEWRCHQLILQILTKLQLCSDSHQRWLRVQDSYHLSQVKPALQVDGRELRLTLPVSADSVLLSAAERRICKLLSGRSRSSSEVAQLTGCGKNKAVNLLQGLVAKGALQITGAGRWRKYCAPGAADLVRGA